MLHAAEDGKWLQATMDTLQGNTTSTSLTFCAHSNPAELAESRALQKAETNDPLLTAEGSHADLGAGQTVGEDAGLTPSP